MEAKLFFFLVGCKLPGRHTEQHDVFMGIGRSVRDCIPALQNFWPDAINLHIDCWREVTNVNGYAVKVFPKTPKRDLGSGLFLYFINLGGYRNGEFEEFHFREIVAAPNLLEAVKLAKKTPFYKQYGFKGAVAHIDNKYGVDVDEIYPVEEMLAEPDKSHFSIVVSNELTSVPDTLHLGYTTISKLK